MSLDQHLRDQLRADADSVTPPDAVRRLQAVRKLNRTRRRRRAIAVVVATVVVVGVIVGVPVVSHLVAGPEPVEKPHKSLFPKTFDGDHLIDSVELDGKKWTNLTFDSDDLRFQWALGCTPGAQASIEIEVKGYPSGWVTHCGPVSELTTPMRQQVGNSFAPDTIAELYGKYLSPGEPITLRARINGYKHVTPAPEDRFGIAAYDMSAERTVIGDVGLTRIKEVNGRQYELVDYATEEPADTLRSFSLDLPAADDPGLLVHGMPTLERRPYVIDGPAALGLFGYSGGGIRPNLLSDQPRSTVTMTMRPRTRYTEGPGVLAYYQALDEPTDVDIPRISFPDTTASRDPLVASDIGSPGETVVRSTFNPTDTNLALANACALPGPGGNSSVQVDLSVNGHRIIWGECSAYDGEVSFGDLPARNRTVWADYGVTRGHPAEVVIRARPKQGSDVSLDGIRLGFAAYERSAPRTEAGGFVLDDYQRWNGEWYELGDHDTVAVTGSDREASLSVPDVDGQLLMGSGNRGGHGGPIHTLVDGRTVGTSAPGPEGFGFQRLDAADDLTIRAGDAVDGGHLVIAYYTPID